MTGPLRFDYADLEHEADRLLERAAERIAEKDADHGGPMWREQHPELHLDLAEDHLLPLREAAIDDDLDLSRTEAADILNHVLMALANVPAEADDAE